MSNKTSDINVGSIDKDIKNIKKYINLVLDKGYCECNELNVISTGRYCDGSKNVAQSMYNILAEREQDKKRIQEIEEEKAMLKKASNIAKEVNIEDVTDVINKSCKEFMSNYIPKQAVIEALEDIEDYFDRLNGPDEDIEYIRQVKEELLEGGK